MKRTFFSFSVFLVIPFRNREEHLSQFLRVIHPFLQAQNVRLENVSILKVLVSGKLTGVLWV